ncbi:MAG: hypothetical protein OXG91_10180, partial [bacterium]|nr:hypothetical protein [bacterium]
MPPEDTDGSSTSTLAARAAAAATTSALCGDPTLWSQHSTTQSRTRRSIRSRRWVTYATARWRDRHLRIVQHGELRGGDPML